jgi:cytochrome c oxidase subunit I+III
VAGTLYCCLIFAYFFLWTARPDAWFPAASMRTPLTWPAVAGALYLGSSVLVVLAGRALSSGGWRGSPWALRLLMVAAVPTLFAAFAADLYAHWSSGLRPSESAYAAVVYTFGVLQGVCVATLVIMGPFVAARSVAGRLDAVRRQSYDCTMLFWHFTVGQGLVGLLIVHSFPRLA